MMFALVLLTILALLLASRIVVALLAALEQTALLVFASKTLAAVLLPHARKTGFALNILQHARAME